MTFLFRAISPHITGGAQAALMTTKSCDYSLPPINGPCLSLISFTYETLPLFHFCSLFFIFPFTFLSLLLFSFLPFRAVSPHITGSAQAELMTTKSCDYSLPPINGPCLSLISFTYDFAPLSFLFLIFPFTFLFLLLFSFLPYSYCLLFCSFCSSAYLLLDPRTIRGFP